MITKNHVRFTPGEGNLEKIGFRKFLPICSIIQMFPKHLKKEKLGNEGERIHIFVSR